MPTTPTSPTTATPLTALLRTRARRHRRPLAAVLAFLAVLALGTSLRAPAAPEGAPAAITLADGEVAVPVTLASSAVAGTVRPGDVVDLVVAQSGDVIAHGARIIEASSAGGFTAAGTAVVVLATDRASALAALSVEATRGALSVLRVNR